MVIFIHGYRTAGKGENVDMLRQCFGDELVVPELQHKPVKDVACIGKMIDAARAKNEKVLLIGCSLGGFYAKVLSSILNVPAILINPAYEPSKSLTSYGTFAKYDTGDLFDWHEQHTRELETFELVESTYAPDKTKLYFFVATDDELLDHSHLKNEFLNVKEFDNCGHRFFRFAEIIPDIKEIYEKID